ncbi:phosphoglycerate mutase family protein [Acholeplasma vituli]|uniref:Phosphoglycerate mutase family protein n=1 Tax=Paracholeplasma vituli TaxID=69473 RepID=A0ABT2PV18_9MOLU|nr:histidine phosphatase family protein [Paracholeplasma vituli]MCU0104796.1 phosphoglycerate mutase family protein [Paracholeplasma vituli]
MTTFIFIRHGEPRYDEVIERGYKNQGYDLGKLTDRGVLQAETVAKEAILKDADYIISSPYTRALQTAAIISRITQIPLTVENDLHEWMPDVTFSDRNDLDEAYPEFMQNKGIRNPNTKFPWESYETLSKRTHNAIKPYLKYKKVIVVCHGIVMGTFTNIEDMIPHCGIRVVNIDESFFK